MNKRLEKYIGTKAFYKMVMAVLLPIVIQNGITNFVSMLDNIMVGRLNTEAMSGVSIINQYVFIFNVCIFGGMAGAGIFGAQYYGSGNMDAMRGTIQFKLIIGAFLSVAAIVLMTALDEPMISKFLNDAENEAGMEETMQFAKQYLKIILWGFPPFAVVQVYSTSMRESGETKVPMYASFAAVLLNLVFNYLLIFGRLGFPRMGVAGAALATVISRYVECALIMFWSHSHPAQYPFFVRLYTKLSMDGRMFAVIAKKGSPLLFNEILWSSGNAIINQSYSIRGLDAVAACNINSTLFGTFSVIVYSVGSAISIIVGQLLGAGKSDEARCTSSRLLTFAVVLGLAVGAVMACISPFFPMMYNTTESVRATATGLLLVAASFMPILGFAHSTYFVLRSGGKTFITFLFDGGFMWAVATPTAYLLSRFTAIPIVPMYALCQCVNIIKCIFGYVLVKKGTWIHNLAAENK